MPRKNEIDNMETTATTIIVDVDAVLKEIEESFSVAGTSNVVDIAVSHLERELKKA